MCVAVPGRVVQLGDGRAVVDVGGAKREVSTVLLPDVKQGEYVLVSLGMAVERLTEEEARTLQDLWQDIAAAQERVGKGG